ncbi:hypothetical protein [Vibrio mediterranei]|uniref:hypothetical protein n=1 Tax=Vibrio mediterranei TaxID=689 RepID=UPI0040693BC7
MRRYYTQQVHTHLYTLVSDFRRLMKQPIEAKVFSKNDETLHQSLAIEEIVEALDADDLGDLCGELCDVLYVRVGYYIHRGYKRVDDIPDLYLLEAIMTYGAKLGLDLLEAFERVHASNMTKCCQTHKEFVETANHYRKLGVKVEPDSSNYGIIVKCSEDTIVDSKIIKRGKVLKSVHYKPADLSNPPRLSEQVA